MDSQLITVWRLVVHHEEPEKMLAWNKQHNRIAMGWGNIGDLGALNLASPGDISNAIQQHYPAINNAAPGGTCLWDLWQVMKTRDLVILSVGSARVAVAEVRGDYEWTTPALVPGDYTHQRRARVTGYSPEKIWKLAGGTYAPGYSIRWPLFPCAKQVRVGSL